MHFFPLFIDKLPLYLFSSFNTLFKLSALNALCPLYLSITLIHIFTAVIGIAKYSGEQLVENEILPQCWLQLTHKHVERRLLIAEACTVLIPYVSVSIVVRVL